MTCLDARGKTRDLKLKDNKMIIYLTDQSKSKADDVRIWNAKAVICCYISCCLV